MAHPEQAYLDLLQRVLDKGHFQEDRTGTGCYSIFGDQIRFPIKDTFPLLTTKKSILERHCGRTPLCF